MKTTTLCYIENNGAYLMLHRTKKKNDLNEGKWIGIGGKVESGETVDDCLIREVFEETGITLTSYTYRGVIDFVSDIAPEEIMHLYTASVDSRSVIGQCNEGDLKWVPINEVTSLPLWEGDKLFLDLLSKGAPFFSMKLEYHGYDLIGHSIEYPDRLK